jgi:hypothetical protein
LVLETLETPPRKSPDDPLRLDIVLYGFGAWWLEQVWQGDFGQAKPW